MSAVPPFFRFIHSRLSAKPLRLLSSLLLATALLPAVTLADKGAVVVAEPYFRETPPGQERTAGFFVATNGSDRNCALIAASAPGIERLELHEHSHEGGMMRMRQVDALPLLAAGSLELRPGGYHLMGFGVAPLTAGDSVAVSLDFGDCGSQTVSFAVVDPRR